MLDTRRLDAGALPQFVRGAERSRAAVESHRAAGISRANAFLLVVIELGLYDSSVKLYRQLAERGLRRSPRSGTQKWKKRWSGSASHASALYPKIPDSLYLCFIHGSQARREPELVHAAIEERQRQMEEHGMVGRRYAGKCSRS